LPWFLKYFIKKVMKNNFDNANWQQDTNDPESKEKPSINIDSRKKSPSKSNKNIDEGEYVDYTEIK